MSLSQTAGAVEGRVKLNRISFAIDGQAYAFSSGAPVARSGQVWILYDAGFTPSGESGGTAYIGMRDLNQLIPAAPGTK